MRGYCEQCAKRETCKKEIGYIFGGCNIDFEQKQPEQHENDREE